MAMNAFLEAIPAWVRGHSELTWGLTLTSAVTFVGSLVAVPPLLTWMPADYLLHLRRQQPREWIARHPVWRVSTGIVKNLFGAVFVVVGIAMLVLPGQGLLTIFVGMTLLDLPGKRKLEVALLRRPGVNRAVGWLRRWWNRPPLKLPEKETRQPGSQRG